jgi:hypothetical protein
MWWIRRLIQMANLSDAYGTMTLKGTWPPELIECLNVIASEIWAKWYYDIQLDPFDTTEVQGGPPAIFSGNGRWAFESNLEALGRWTADDIEDRPELSAVYNKVLSEMYAHGLTIEASYSDEEGGNLVLYRQTGLISSDGEAFRYEVTSEEIFDYNWENYMDVTDHYEGFNSLVESLCEQLGVEDDENGLIERWAKKRTLPHYSDFDELNDDLKAEFMETFVSNNK